MYFYFFRNWEYLKSWKELQSIRLTEIYIMQQFV